MTKKNKVSVGYTQYTPGDRIWHCYNKKKDMMFGLNDFDVMMMKDTKKYKPFYLKDNQVHKIRKEHRGVKTLRLGTIKDKAYQHIKDGATRKEIEHPFSNTALFIDCYLTYNTEQFSDKATIFDGADIQVISRALDHIFTYYHLNRRINPIVNDLSNNKISVKDARYKIEQVIKGKAIRYIPFGSPLQKAMTKAVEHAKTSYQSVLGGSDSNMFGLFYIEDKGHNIIRDILEKESD